MSDEAYALSLASAARRVLAEGPPRGLPVAVAAAVTEFVTGALLDNPHRVGKPLARELAGYHSARRGAYRVVYRIDERARGVRDFYQMRAAGKQRAEKTHGREASSSADHRKIVPGTAAGRYSSIGLFSMAL